ncbi:MAG: hypothetical protein ABI321_11785 [Polyangia bacterium]
MPDSSPQRRAALYPLLLLGLGLLLFVPRLGANGLWDPSEVRVADAARLVSDGHPPAHFDLNQHVIAEGFRVLGAGELGGRLPLALLSVLLLLVAYWAGRAVMRPRAALLGGVVLATMPVTMFSARQLTTQAPLLLGVTLAAGGLAHLFWPRDDEGMLARAFAFVAAVAGLVIGTLAAGLFAGALGPLIGVTAALLVARPRGRSLLLALVTLAVIAFTASIAMKRGTWTWWLAGTPRLPHWQTVFTTAIKPLGFATAPWGALLPFAVLRSLDGARSEAPDTRHRFAAVFLPAWLAAAYFMGTLQDALVGDVLVPAAPVMALLAGGYLDSLLEDGFGSALEGVVVGALVFVLGHDVLMATDVFVSVLNSEQIRFPNAVQWTGDVLFAGLGAFAVVIAASMILPVVWPRPDDARVPALQRRLLWGAIAVQIGCTLMLAYWFIPVTSHHLSPKELYGRARQLDPKAPLAQYRFTASGASYYMNGRTSKVLATPDDVIKFLQQPERVFIFIGSEELAAVDQVTRLGGKKTPALVSAPDATPDASTAVAYYVIDDSNSRFLILSNRLGAGEKDLNPIRRFVSTSAPKPTVPTAVNFDDKLMLVGYDLPTEAPHGADIMVRLYFHVLQPVGASYKVFLHFDGPGARINGDHVPVDGHFPTQFWSAGTYVTDEYVLKPEHNDMSGLFQLYFGLFSGDHRMKVNSGASDGENRVKLGAVRVR